MRSGEVTAGQEGGRGRRGIYLSMSIYVTKNVIIYIYCPTSGSLVEAATAASKETINTQEPLKTIQPTSVEAIKRDINKLHSSEGDFADKVTIFTSDVDPDWLYPDPDPGQKNHQIDFKTSFKSKYIVKLFSTLQHGTYKIGFLCYSNVCMHFRKMLWKLKII